MLCLRFRGTIGRVDADLLPVASLPLEGDHAVDEREERVVLPLADVDAGPEAGAALAHEDVAGQNLLTAEALDAEILGIGVATVLGRASTFFMSHDSLLKIACEFFVLIGSCGAVVYAE